MNERLTRFVLAGSMFIMGACGLIYEYVLSVLGNYLIGSSHEEIFIIIGLMMFAMGLGTIFQRRIRKHLVDRFLLLELALGLIGGFAASGVYALFAISESYRVALYGLAILIGVLIGMEIPILIRINRRYSQSLRANLSEILSMDYAGALAGALVFTYFLLSHISLPRISFLLGLTNLLIGVVGILVFYPLVHRPKRLAAFAVLGGLALGYGFLRADDWAQWAEQRYFRDPIVYHETSRYQHIVVTKREDRLQLYLNGHLQFSSVDEAIYHEMLVHPAMHVAKKHSRVLILGGGDGLALREVLKYDGVERITLVDIDPAIIRLAQNFPDLVRLNANSLQDARVRVSLASLSSTEETQAVKLRSERLTEIFDQETIHVADVEVFCVDADSFLREVTGDFDVALIDFPDPSQIELAKLYSRDFYRTLKQHLSEDAIIAVQSTSPFHAKKVFLCIGETLRASGFSPVPLHQNVPTFGEWGFHLAHAQSEKSDSLRNRLREGLSFDVETRFLTGELVAAATHFGKNWLQTEQPIKANSKIDPVMVRYYRDAWKLY